MSLSQKVKSPIGIFDSGYGGLTILNEMRSKMPQYDFLYLGDNARSPYGTRSFDVVYKFTLQCVEYLFSQGCELVILACNTASAKALRTIQQKDLPKKYPNKRVLGVIRPTVEAIGKFTKSRKIGLFATNGTVVSNSYPLEVEKLYTDIKVYSVACPMWVPLIENGEHLDKGADFFVKKYSDELMQKGKNIDTVILGCTHYPLLKDKIRSVLPQMNILSQGSIVAGSLIDYLKRHTEIDDNCSKNGITEYLTTENVDKFSSSATVFLSENIVARKIELNS
ncbi:MAG: glutamate racemase [Paludibacter sp.]|nr:MAG: glutamate racemase [Paludibacter sp.]